MNKNILMNYLISIPLTILVGWFIYMPMKDGFFVSLISWFISLVIVVFLTIAVRSVIEGP